MLNITFSDDIETKKFILSLFDKTANLEGLLIEEESKQPVLDINGQEIFAKRVGVISNGSEIYVKDDIVSLVEFYQRRVN